MRIRGEMTDQDRALLGEMLTRCGVEMTVDEFLTYITEATVEELRGWHRNAREMRAAFGLVIEAIDTREES